MPRIKRQIGGRMSALAEQPRAGQDDDQLGCEHQQPPGKQRRGEERGYAERVLRGRRIDGAQLGVIDARVLRAPECGGARLHRSVRVRIHAGILRAAIVDIAPDVIGKRRLREEHGKAQPDGHQDDDVHGQPTAHSDQRGQQPAQGTTCKQPEKQRHMPAQIAETRERDQNAQLSAEQQQEAHLWSHAGNVASPRVHIIIPVLNEEAALRVLLPALSAVQQAAVIVVDNGSTDTSVAVAAQAGVRVVREPQRGYGAACLAGIAALEDAGRDDVILFMDGDASDDVTDIPNVVTPVQCGDVDLVIGSRVLGERERGALAAHARFGNWLATRMIYHKTSVRFTDLGPLRAIRVDALRRLRMQNRNYGWTVEMQLKAAELGLRIQEVPVRYRKRIGKSKISGTVRGSLRAGVVILQTILRHGH
jgi:hypothetical protein